MATAAQQIASVRVRVKELEGERSVWGSVSAIPYFFGIAREQRPRSRPRRRSDPELITVFVRPDISRARNYPVRLSETAGRPGRFFSTL